MVMLRLSCSKGKCASLALLPMCSAFNWHECGLPTVCQLSTGQTRTASQYLEQSHVCTCFYMAAIHGCQKGQPNCSPWKKKKRLDIQPHSMHYNTYQSTKPQLCLHQAVRQMGVFNSQEWHACKNTLAPCSRRCCLAFACCYRTTCTQI